MSLSEILDELPRLTPEQRHQVVERVMELDGDWIDEHEDFLSPEEKRLIESRLAEHDRDPASAIPWEEAKARLKARSIR
jgi:putative addiction module component (TIGR02574 family)